MPVMNSLRFLDRFGRVVLLGCLAAPLGCDSGNAETSAADEDGEEEDSDSGDDNEEDSGSSGGADEEEAEDGSSSGSSSSSSSGSSESEGSVPGLGEGEQGGAGMSDNRYHKANVTRSGQSYFFMANGWGPNFGSQEVSFEGTSFTVISMEGSQGSNWEPASYPTVFCGVYSDEKSRTCGLPASIDSINSLRTGWEWSPNGNSGEYNAAYDIWVGTDETRESHSGFLMVWLREPPGQQPAGSRMHNRVTVENVPGEWDIWSGRVGNLPIINWVRAEGDDTTSLEFDVMDFVRDAEERGMTIPGSHILSVAVGFEIWNGPVSNLESIDFYVDVQ